MAEREMHTLVVDKTVGAQTSRCLLGTLPALLKGLDVGYFRNISGKGGWITAAPFFLLQLLRIVHFVIFLVIVDNC